MSLLYKDDWTEAQQMLTGWWNRKVEGRWALGVISKRNEPLPHTDPPPLSDDFKTRWLDYKTLNAHKEAFFAQYSYLGCVYPEDTAYLGPGSLNAFLGSAIDFQKETLWYSPISNNPEKVDQLRIDRNGFYWKWTQEALQYVTDRANGKYIATMPDLIEGMDIPCLSG